MIRIFLFLVFMLMTSGSFAFSLLKNGTIWPNGTTNVYILDKICKNNRLTWDKILDYTKMAVDKFWKDVPGSSLNLRVSNLIIPENTFDEGIFISCSTTNDLLSRKDEHGEDIHIFAVTRYYPDNKLKFVDILINDHPITRDAPYNDYDAINTLGHELGHAIGLDHSDIPGTLMYPYLEEDIDRLAKDDIDGLIYLYPAPRRSRKLGSGCGSIQEKDKPNLNFPTSFLLGTFLFIFVALPIGRRLHLFANNS